MALRSVVEERESAYVSTGHLADAEKTVQSLVNEAQRRFSQIAMEPTRSPSRAGAGVERAVRRLRRRDQRAGLRRRRDRLRILH
ncbi:hypothetical protein [Bradyrhizobium sp. CCBAU 53415]|uniref:hypothetical protein n=1 Tax=Bradyrhizobium sp. CCBAU 53415 TaxID=1325119 RepID=UPI002306097D|nr:hypothetical protein [Bradyrhizobium sp. CCBAU 53415]